MVGIRESKTLVSPGPFSSVAAAAGCSDCNGGWFPTRGEVVPLELLEADDGKIAGFLRLRRRFICVSLVSLRDARSFSTSLFLDKVFLSEHFNS